MSRHDSEDRSETAGPRRQDKRSDAGQPFWSGGQRAASLAHRSEVRLVRSATRGDKRAISELYQRHVDTIYRYVVARVGDAATAEDLTAQVFLKALEGLPNYEPGSTPFVAWLYRIAHARVVDHWRQQQRRQEVALAESIPASCPPPEDVVAARTEWEMAVEMLGELTSEQRDVVILRFLEEMSLAEVAVMMDKSVGSVKALQHRALASLGRLAEQRAGLARSRND